MLHKPTRQVKYPTDSRYAFLCLLTNVICAEILGPQPNRHFHSVQGKWGWLCYKDDTSDDLVNGNSEEVRNLELKPL